MGKLPLSPHAVSALWAQNNFHNYEWIDRWLCLHRERLWGGQCRTACECNVLFSVFIMWAVLCTQGREVEGSLLYSFDFDLIYHQVRRHRWSWWFLLYLSILGYFILYDSFLKCKCIQVKMLWLWKCQLVGWLVCHFGPYWNIFSLLKKRELLTNLINQKHVNW